MKTAIVTLAAMLAAAPASAQLGGALGKIEQGGRQADKAKGLKISDADERKIGEQVSLQIRDSVRRLPGQGGDEVRHPGRHAARAGQLAAEPELGVHRPRHRRRQRLRRARRDRPHHPRRARSGEERGGAGRRARATRSRTSPRSTRSTRSRRANALGMGAEQLGKGGHRAGRHREAGRQAYKNVLNNKFDRNEENEADKLGIVLAEQGRLRAERARRPC